MIPNPFALKFTVFQPFSKNFFLNLRFSIHTCCMVSWLSFPSSSCAHTGLLVLLKAFLYTILHVISRMYSWRGLHMRDTSVHSEAFFLSLPRNATCRSTFTNRLFSKPPLRLTKYSPQKTPVYWVCSVLSGWMYFTARMPFWQGDGGAWAYIFMRLLFLSRLSWFPKLWCLLILVITNTG